MSEVDIIRARAAARARQQAQPLPVDPHMAEVSKLALQGQLPAGEATVNEYAGGVIPSPKQAMRNLKENFLGDDNPNSLNRGEFVGSLLNKAGESLTFGTVGDEASAAVESIIPGVNYEDRRDHYRQQEEVLERDNPGAALGADVGGAVAGMATPMGMAGTLARGAKLIPRVAASIGAGALGGGTYGFAEGEGIDDRLSGAATGGGIGAGVGAAVPVVGAGIQKVADAFKRNSAIKKAAAGAPSTGQQREAGQALYRQIDDAGVEIKPEAFSNARKNIVDALRAQGLDELPGPGSLTPKSARVMQIAKGMEDEMATDATSALPFSSLDQLRRHAGTAAADIADGKPTTDARLGSEAISQLDEFVKGLNPDDVEAGDINALQTLLPKARDLWARMSRSQKIDDAIENSGSYLSGGASGIRNQFARIARNPKTMRGFSEAEQQVIKRVAQGTLPEQALYLAASGLGNIGSIGLGAMTGGPWGALAGAGAAFGLRKGAEKLAGRNAEIARAVIANGRLEKMPVATDSARKIAESLMRRTAAVTPQ